jgi:hypothetical protein
LGESAVSISIFLYVLRKFSLKPFQRFKVQSTSTKQQKLFGILKLQIPICSWKIYFLTLRNQQKNKAPSLCRTKLHFVGLKMSLSRIELHFFVLNMQNVWPKLDVVGLNMWNNGIKMHFVGLKLHIIRLNYICKEKTRKGKYALCLPAPLSYETLLP